MSVTLYLIGVVSCLAATWEAWRICARRLRVSVAWLITCLNASLLLYLGALLPGMIGCLTAGWIAGTLAVLSIAAIAFWNWWGRQVPVAADRAEMPGGQGLTGINAGTLAVGILALLLLAPLTGFLGELPFQLGPSAVVLEWDTVSYHLPELIQFLQQHTLWYQGGVYSSYSFGFELMAALPVACFHSSWPLVPVHLLGLTVALSGLYVVSEQLTEAVNRLVRRPFPTWPVFLLAAGLVARLFAFEMSRIGKNDLYQSGALLAAVAFLFEYRRSCTLTQPVVLQRFFFGGAGVAMGLALSAKPNALAYLPTFALLAALAAPNSALGGNLWVRRARAALVALVIVGAVGGFFLARNLIMFHGLIPPEHVWMMQYSLLRVVLNPQKWGWYEWEWVVLLSLAAAMIPLAYGWIARRKNQDWWIFAALLGLHATALGAFMNTSYSVLPTGLVIVPRMGMMFFVTGAIFLALGVVVLFSTLATIQRLPALRLTVWAALLAGIVGSPFYFQSFLDSLKPQGGLGLPGALYEQPWGVPTRIYKVIQLESQPLRIYAAGLRPLGLYGKNYKNTVFYDLHSSTTYYNHQTPDYLMAVLEQFKPDRVIMAVDSNRESREPVLPPLVTWMRQHPQYFTPLYDNPREDPMVYMYRVEPGWEALKAQYPPSKEPIRMGY